MQFIIIHFILSMFQWLSFITEFILYDHVMSSVFCDHIFTVLINNSLFLHLHQFHWFISLIMSRWFHTESDHSMTATDVRVHYLHSWSQMMKCLHKCFPSVISEWRKWKKNSTNHMPSCPSESGVCFSKSGEARTAQFWFSGKKTPTNV